LFVPGAEATFSAEATDNVDLAALDFRLVFRDEVGGVRSLPMSLTFAAGTPYTGTLSRSFATPARLTFVRTLTAIAAGSRTTALVDSARVRAVDAAGMAASLSRVITPSMYGGNSSTADPFSAVSSITATSSTPMICTLRCGSLDQKATLLTVRIVGSAGLSPFARLHWFLRTPDGTISQVSAIAGFSVSDTGTQRTYTYSLAYAPAAGLNGEHTLFAVAVNSSGNALKSSDLAVDLVAR
jgi:hypothetical protein